MEFRRISWFTSFSLLSAACGVLCDTHVTTDVMGDSGYEYSAIAPQNQTVSV